MLHNKNTFPVRISSESLDVDSLISDLNSDQNPKRKIDMAVENTWYADDGVRMDPEFAREGDDALSMMSVETLTRDDHENISYMAN